MAYSQAALDDADIAREPLQAVIARIARELGAVGHLIESLEGHLCAPLNGTALDENDRIQTLQGIDMAVQQVIGLSEFLDELGAVVPQECVIDIQTALNVVKLADMKRRLSVDDDAVAGRRQAIGEMEMF